MLQNGMRTSNSIIKDEIKQTRTAIDSLYKKEAVNLGMSEKEFRKGTSSMAELDKRMEGYQNYKRVQNDIDIARRSVSIASAEGLKIDQKTYETAQMRNPYEQFKAWGVFKDDGQTYTQIVNLIKEMTSLQTQNYNNTAQIYRSINRVDGVTVGGARGGGSYTPPQTTKTVEDPFANIKFQQGTFDGGLISNDFSQNITELANMYVKTSVADSLRQLDPEKLKAMLQGTDTANIFRNAPTTPPPPGKQPAKEKSGMDEISKAAKAFGAMNNIMSALQNMGIKLPEGLQKTVGMMQSLISVIQSVQSVVQMFATSSQAANTIAVGANTVALGALTGAISANTAVSAIPFFAGGGVVKSITSNSKRFANGGIAFGNSIGATTIQHFAGGGLVQNIHHHAANGFVGGNNYSGDLIPIAVNSGELILNKAQQGNLASQLSEGSSFANLNIEKRITAEDIRLVLNNSRRRRSRGETL